MGRPRKFGVERHPGGSVVRQVWDAGKGYALSFWKTDNERAKRDPREGSVAGKLELLGTVNGGINRFERHAGEKFAEIVTAWRKRKASSPNPNAPAANLEGGTGKSPQGDPFNLSDAESDRIETTCLRYEAMRKLICRKGADKPPLKVLQRGQKVWDLLEALFICNQKIDAGSIKFMRRYGLKPLVLHFRLTGDDDAT